jgi:Tfp pilus assembly protein PilO
MNININPNFKILPKKSIGIFLFIIIIYIGYILDLHYQFNRFLRAREHTYQLEAKIQEINNKIHHTDQYQAELAQTQQQFDQIKITMPDTAHFQNFLDKIKLLGESKGLKFLTISPGTPNSKDFYHIVSVQFTLQGNYQQFLDFLNALNTAHDFVTINNFTIVRQAPAAMTVLNNENTPDELMINTTAVFYIF